MTLYSNYLRGMMQESCLTMKQTDEVKMMIECALIGFKASINKEMTFINELLKNPKIAAELMQKPEMNMPQAISEKQNSSPSQSAEGGEEKKRMVGESPIAGESEKGKKKWGCRPMTKKGKAKKDEEIEKQKSQQQKKENEKMKKNGVRQISPPKTARQMPARKENKKMTNKTVQETQNPTEPTAVLSPATQKTEIEDGKKQTRISILDSGKGKMAESEMPMKEKENSPKMQEEEKTVSQVPQPKCDAIAEHSTVPATTLNFITVPKKEESKIPVTVEEPKEEKPTTSPTLSEKQRTAIRNAKVKKPEPKQQKTISKKMNMNMTGSRTTRENKENQNTPNQTKIKTTGKKGATPAASKSIIQEKTEVSAMPTETKAE